jgi:hypothetical protein
MALARNTNHNIEYLINSTEHELSARQSKKLKLSRLVLKDVKLRRRNNYIRYMFYSSSLEGMNCLLHVSASLPLKIAYGVDSLFVRRSEFPTRSAAVAFKVTDELINLQIFS